MPLIPSSDDKVSKTASVALNFLQNKLTKSDEFSFLDIGCHPMSRHYRSLSVTSHRFWYEEIANVKNNLSTGS
jgi:hypothetical protein